MSFSQDAGDVSTPSVDLTKNFTIDTSVYTLYLKNMARTSARMLGLGKKDIVKMETEDKEKYLTNLKLLRNIYSDHICCQKGTNLVNTKKMLC